MSLVKGMLLPLPTAFDEDGAVDEKMTRALVDFYVGAGVHGLFVNGSFGNGPAMTQEERLRVAAFCLDQVKGRVPVIVHIGTPEPRTAIELGKAALAKGADAVGIVGPYYYSDKSPAEVRLHFREIGKAIKAPILLYNNTKYQGYPIGPQLMAQLVEDSPQIFGTKLGMGGIDEALEYIRAINPSFAVFALASSLYPGMLVGITGTISPPLALYPEVGVKLVEAINAGNHPESLRLQELVIDFHATLLELMKKFGRGAFTVGLRMRGLNVKKYPRWPVIEVPEDSKARVQALIHKVDAALAKPKLEAVRA